MAAPYPSTKEVVMKWRKSLLLAFFVAMPAWAQHAGHHQAVTASQLKWSPVPSLPKGAQISVIEGPMNQAVPFTVRLKFPDNYRIPPHTHPAVERVTVLSGTFHMGMGEKFDRSATHPVATGDMMIMQPGTAHYAWTEGEVVVQLHGTGPWGLTYINTADDPRNQ
jgi:quercetin dioxygenase-like cupin family protein